MGKNLKMILYKAYNPISDSYYIGKTVNTLRQRKTQHKADAKLLRNNSVFHKAIRKYGFDVFVWKVIGNYMNVDELNIAEINTIKNLRDKGFRLYNLSKGGDGGDVGGSKYWKENGITDEMKIKISESLKEYYKTHVHSSKGKKTNKSWNKGLTKETNESMMSISKGKIGIPRTDETKEKLRLANIGKKLQPHVIDILKEKFSGKNNPSAKPIICTTTGEYFDYAKLAAVKYNSDLSAIIKCCKGKSKTVKGKKYEYA